MFGNITILGKTFSAYQLLAILGLFCAGVPAVLAVKKRGHSDTDFIVTLLWASLGGLVGAHLLYAVTNIPYLLKLFSKMQSLSPLQLIQDFMLLFSGAVYYGGMLGGLITGSIYARKKGLPVRDYLDAAAFSLPLFHFFGRIGCFLSGCCYGIPCSFGITYHHAAIDMANHVKRFPVQLAEAVCNLILFAVLFTLFRKRLCKGKLIYMYLVAYACVRFGLEFLRGDSYRGILAGLSTSQWISIPLILFACGKLFTIKQHAFLNSQDFN